MILSGKQSEGSLAVWGWTGHCLQMYDLIGPFGLKHSHSLNDSPSLTWFKIV